MSRTLMAPRKNRNTKGAAIAKSLETSGEYIGALDSQTSMFNENSEYSYSVLWQDLQQLVETNSIDSMGSKAYGIALYSRVAAMIVTHYADFFATGNVAVADMHALLDRLESALSEIQLTDSEVNRGFGVLIEGAQQNVSTARSMNNGLKGGVE